MIPPMSRKYITHDLDGPQVARDYVDSAGQPLREGDVIAFAASRGSSAKLQYAIIDKFVDKDQPKNVKNEWDRQADEYHTWRSWRNSWTLRLRYIQFDKEAGVFRLERSYVSGRGWVDPKSLDDVKLNRIEKIENIVRVDVPVELPRP